MPWVTRSRAARGLWWAPVVLVWSGACAAQETQKDTQAEGTSANAQLKRFEVTPFLGYRMGGRFDIEGSNEQADVDSHVSYALALDLLAHDQLTYELFYSRQPTHLDSSGGGAGLDVEYFQLAATSTEDDAGYLKPYLIGAVGLTRLSLSTAGASDKTRFSLSMGGGLRVPVRAGFDVRLEARVYLTFLDTSSSLFCGSGSSGGACAIRASGSAFVQYELLAGTAFSF